MGESLVARALRLRREIAGHKQVIRDRRSALQAAAAALADLEAESRRLGIRLIVHEGEGDIHGQSERTRA